MAMTDKKPGNADKEKQYATIRDLPEEMLEQCCKYSAVQSLKALRLTYKKILPAATKQLFRHVEVMPTE
ncbi:hypothetical protein CLAFUW4_09194 [Fulvia fulva]|uniref:F-box domain-containing protein n=1 Tax=Passalora fulva TaxID=5499 RepID=A0A9Q8UT95_PASFU|nr:uncharacterized protein CLAFUR5_09294 [Fulvia fulva]KAK4613354.1 hypothetical protein CLAFUR4_09200 [Fulvia fulva]KAK4614550.1 hypothetical protein CLAFUR0_09192 [Fulvia fulva]UJO21550.1 hypothetical protein CLAFUR5_09294 [Fulvia fulva]WPV20701.1 hypothetical protein CLAFUW4_09194 [Fulvia fulva]WPV35199.1 hypothetical protein CLAFUW7_09195 [Fulvia fulva]